MVRWALTFSGAASRKVVVKELRGRKSRDPRPLRTGNFSFAEIETTVFHQLRLGKISTAIFLNRSYHPYINSSLRGREKESDPFKRGLSEKRSRLLSRSFPRERLF